MTFVPLSKVVTTYNSCTFEIEKVAKRSSARWLSPFIVGQNLNDRTRSALIIRREDIYAVMIGH